GRRSRYLHFCFIKCYMYVYKYIDSKMTWTEAQEYCRENHTDLATVTNMTDVKRLNKTAKQRPAWIGLKNHTNSDKTWHWSLPGLSFNKNKTHWNMDEPNNDGNELCKTSAHISLFFVSSTDTNTSQKFHLIEMPLNWTNAQRYCRENHTDLISGLQQLNQLNQTWNDSMKAELANETNVFIGLFSDAWAWSDESSFSFRNWDPQRDRENEELGCAALTDQGTWRNDNCSKQRSFICYEGKIISNNRTPDSNAFHNHYLSRRPLLNTARPKVTNSRLLLFPTCELKEASESNYGLCCQRMIEYNNSSSGGRPGSKEFKHWILKDIQ
uniref:C-type lectin domain-containing protein n=1 Tax=Oryzias melastigma TaxID=30732 RepID=A0A3B3DXS5_ORYME